MKEFSPEAVRDRSLKVRRELDAANRSKKAKRELDNAAEEKKKKRLHENIEALTPLLGLVADNNYSDASALVQDVLNARVVAALDDYKQSVAQTLFAPSLNEEKKDDDKDKDDEGDKEDKKESK